VELSAIVCVFVVSVRDRALHLLCSVSFFLFCSPVVFAHSLGPIPMDSIPSSCDSTSQKRVAFAAMLARQKPKWELQENRSGYHPHTVGVALFCFCCFCFL
jgi:hypothetical protein